MLRSWTWWALERALALLALMPCVSCGDGIAGILGNAGGNSAGNPSPLAGSGPVVTGCAAHESCACPSGLSSFTSCDADGNQSCDCASCPDFNPTAGETPFNACGGAVFGSWLIKSHDVSSIKGTFYYSNLVESTVAICDSEAHDLSEPDFLLVLEDGGTGKVRLSGEEVSTSVLDSCLREKVPGCEMFEPCKLQACGVCTCDHLIPGVTADGAAWSTTGSVLSINAGTTFAHSFNYCVQGDELLLEESQTSDRFTLSRTNLFGKPTACASRNMKTCEVDGSCHTGTCVGNGCPAAQTEAACTNKMGCTWDASVCGGTPSPVCSITDYGVVPGCVQQTAMPHCGGQPTPCSTSSTQAACAARKGCAPQAGCTGNLTVDCNTNVIECSYCPGGCSCVAEALHWVCTGVGHCAEQPNYNLCFSMGCTWDSFATCNGTPPTCESLSVDECGSVAGCGLTAD